MRISAFSLRVRLVVFACLFFFAGLFDANYFDPPHAEVAQRNDALGPSLLGVRIAALGERPRSNPLRYFSIRVHAVYPSVDGSILSSNPPRVLWSWSYDSQQEFDWSGSLSGCGSNRSRARFSGAGGSFRLHSELPGQSLVFENPSNPAQSGFSTVDLNASAGPLSIWVEGRLFLSYSREVQTVQCRSFCYWNGCSIQSWVETSFDQEWYTYDSYSPIFSSTVERQAGIVVSLSPWVQNYSVFLPILSAFVFSNLSAYRLETFLDGVSTGSRNYFSFNVLQDDLGVQSIVSIPDDSAQSHMLLPAKFFKQPAASTHRYSYRVDQDVKTAGNGRHVWTVSARDFFGGVLESKFSFSAHAGAKFSLNVSDYFLEADGQLSVSVRLTDSAGHPLAGKSIELESSAEHLNLTTDSSGFAKTRLVLPQAGAHRIIARFPAQDGYASAFAEQVVYVSSNQTDGIEPPRYDYLLLGFLTVLALCAVRFR